MYVFDIETDGLDNYTKIHCLVYCDLKTDSYYELVDEKEIKEFFSLDNAFYIGHNILRYDLKVIEELLKVSVKDNIVDTLGLSWYLYPKKKLHGLETYGTDFKIPKVQIDDWKGLELKDYLARCRRDVEINVKLWKQMYSYLQNIYETENGIWKLINYISHKLYCARLAEDSKWKLNVNSANDLLDDLHKQFSEKEEELQQALPSVPKYKTIKKPLVLEKKDGTLSKAGERWYHLADDSVDSVEILDHYEQPNANSVKQQKDWLFSLGWEPTTFKYNKKNVAVPQISKDGEVCESIVELIEKEPAVEALKGFSVLKHRIPYVENLIKDSKDSFIKAEIAGFTNTMRFIHKSVVNVPSIDKPFGKEIRGLFEARNGYELCGSDMSSLEDRTKQHFIFPYDPEYVKEMDKPDFDPHIDIAVIAGTMTQEEGQAYKDGDHKLKSVRFKAKTTNYSCTYGAGPSRIARDGNMSIQDATTLHSSFWKRNKSIKEVAKNVKIKTVGEQMWLFNPVSRLWYSLRYMKDVFSTLNQSTGAYCFDLWVYFVIQDRPQLTGQFHDEFIIEVLKGYRKETEEFLREKIKLVNEHLKLNKELDIDVQFGNNYSEIH